MTIEFRPAEFIETTQGDLVAASQIGSLRHWPGLNGCPHRVNLTTKNGGTWELYRGSSEKEALAVRDAMKAKINTAVTPPMPKAFEAES